MPKMPARPRLTHLQRPSRMSAARESNRREGPREYVEPSTSLPGRSFGVAKPPRRPRHLTLRPGKKSYQLVLGVSSRRAADRSPTQHAGRREDSIGIISTKVRDNTQAIGTTCGRPVWLRCHGLTVGVGEVARLPSGERPPRATRRSYVGTCGVKVTARTPL